MPITHSRPRAGEAKRKAAELAARFRALADPTRIGILERLSGGERCVCELTDALDAAQSRLSFHLGVLKKAGMIQDRREGRWVYYSLVPGAFEALGHRLHAYTEPSPAAACSAGCCAPILLRGKPVRA